MGDTNAWQKKMYDKFLAELTLGSAGYARIAATEARFLLSAMGLRKGETLLDVPCGTGRHARVFARAGIKVTGVDLSTACLRLAKAANRGSPITYRKGNLLDLSPFHGRFDAVVNLFTSFGYFKSEAENFRVLRQMVSCLKPGGRLAVHLIDRDWLLRNFQANSWQEKNGLLMLDARKYDAKTKRIEAQTVLLNRNTGKGKSYYHETRLYSKSELVALFRAAGLVNIRVYGDTDGSIYRKGESSHPIYLAWKPTKS